MSLVRHNPKVFGASRMKVGDLVRSRTSCDSVAVVIKAHKCDQLIRVLFLKSSATGWVNKYAFEVISESR